MGLYLYNVCNVCNKNMRIYIYKQIRFSVIVSVECEECHVCVICIQMRDVCTLCAGGGGGGGNGVTVI